MPQVKDSAMSPARAATLALDKELNATARAINPVLRRELATWQLRRLVSKPRRPEDRGKKVALFIPSWWTMAPLAALALRMLVVAGPRAPLFWAIMLAGTVVALWLEWKVVPRIALIGYSFRLLRYEGQADDGRQIFTAASWGKGTGFRRITFEELGDFSADQIVAVLALRDEVRAVIYLRRDQPLDVHSFPRQVYQEDALPPLSPAVEKIAAEFGHAAHSFKRTEVKVEQERTLRAVERPRPTKPVADAWAGLVLDQDIKKQLIASASHFASGSASATRGLLLYGPPGTGKTEIAKALAASMGCAFLSKKLSDLKAEYIGQSSHKVTAVWKEALGHDRAVLFIDECDAAFARRDGKTDEFVKEIVNAFIAEWEGFDQQSTVWVVGATNRRDEIDPAVLSRFAEQVEIALPGGEQRVEILAGELRRAGIRASLPAETARLTQGMAGRDLSTLAKSLARVGIEGEAISVDALARLTGGYRKQSSITTDAQARWDNLVLAEPVMQQLQRTARLLQHAEQFRQQNLSVPQAMLLFGPPGTGKTQIARTLANETGLSFLSASTGDLKGRHLGESAGNVKQLFQRARENSPALLFLDEVDVLAPARGAGDSYTTEMIGQLLQEMDGVEAHGGHVFVLAATNLPDSLDSAVRSRFALEVEIPRADLPALERLVRVMLAGKPIGFDLDVRVAELCVDKLGWSGRDLRAWIGRAEQRAMARALDSDNPANVCIQLDDFASEDPSRIAA